jgi:hypothetical protein
MEEALRSLLTGYAPLTALVGQRIYWDEVPQGAQRPCVVMYVVSSIPGYHMQGEDCIKPVRVQIDCQAKTTVTKWAVARAVHDRLSGYRGTVSGIRFGGIFQQMDRDKSDKDTESNTLRVRQQDWEVWFAASA